jgi:hypothetical protein
MLAALAGPAWAQFPMFDQLAVPSYLGQPAHRPNTPDTTVRITDPAYDLLVSDGLPYRSPVNTPQQNFNLKLGRATASFYAALQVGYQNNALATPGSSGRQDNILITPSVGTTIVYPINELNSFRIDLGVGYNINTEFPELNSLFISPASFIDYRIIVGEVLITLFNTTATPAQTRPEIVGNGNPVAVDFNRIQNSTGVSAGWSWTEDTSVSGSYSYMFDKGFDDSYGIADSSTHGFSTGVFHRLTPRLTLGLSGSYSILTFSENFQNDMTSWGVGPVISVRPTEFINLSVSVRYTVSTFEQNGAIADTSEFDGLTFSFAAGHQLTRNINHSVFASSGIQPGLGSNFSEQLSAGYALGWQFHPRMGLNFGFNYTDVQQSGAANTTVPVIVNGVLLNIPVTFLTNEKVQLYNFTLGTGYQFSPKLNGSLGYGLNLRNSDQTDRDVDEHSVFLGLSYRF